MLLAGITEQLPFHKAWDICVQLAPRYYLGKEPLFIFVRQVHVGYIAPSENTTSAQSSTAHENHLFI